MQNEVNHLLDQAGIHGRALLSVQNTPSSSITASKASTSIVGPSTANTHTPPHTLVFQATEPGLGPSGNPPDRSPTLHSPTETEPSVESPLWTEDSPRSQPVLPEHHDSPQIQRHHIFTMPLGQSGTASWTGPPSEVAHVHQLPNPPAYTPFVNHFHTK